MPSSVTRAAPDRAEERRRGRAGACGIVSRIVLLLLPILGGCSGETPQRRVELSTRVKGEPASAFANAWGWSVSVSDAWLSLDGLWLLEGEPLGRGEAPHTPGWRGWLIKTAHAHPGHYQEGNVLAEMLVPAVIDLGGVTQLAASDALTAEPHSGRIAFGAPAVPSSRSDALPPAEPAVVGILGRAERADSDGGSSTRHFIALAGSDVAPTEVTGCPYEGGPLRASGSLELTVDLRVWLDQVDFGELPGGTEDRPTPLAADARAWNGFLRGLEKASAYVFRFREGTP